MHIACLIIASLSNHDKVSTCSTGATLQHEQYPRQWNIATDENEP